ncbi:MAG: deaminase, partial [Pseudomonadota bacterium]
CAMCAGAISLARLGRLVFAADDPKGGAVRHGPKFFDQPTCHWKPEIVQDATHADESSQLLREFFRSKRK